MFFNFNINLLQNKNMINKVVKDVIFYTFFNGLYVSSICAYHKYVIVIVNQTMINNSTKIDK
jgi:hypothetical protein